MRKFLLGIAALLVLAVLVWWFTPTLKTQAFARPWQVKVLPDGSSMVVGVTLSTTTLGEAAKRFAMVAEAAYIVDANKAAVVELFYAHVSLGGVTGKLVLSAPTVQAMADGWEEKAEVSPERSQFLELKNWQRFADEKIATAAFIPTKNLSETLIMHSFGQATEILSEGRNKRHFLYPEIGVDVVLHALGKDVIQYVLPEQFDAIRKPLLALQRRLELQEKQGQ